MLGGGRVYGSQSRFLIEMVTSWQRFEGGGGECGCLGKEHSRRVNRRCRLCSGGRLRSCHKVSGME